MPTPYDPKKTEIRGSYLTTTLLTFQPGLTPAALPEDLEAAMALFVHSEHCPRLVREEYLKSMEQDQRPEEEVEPLLPSPAERDPGAVEQDPYMAGLGARLTTRDLNNTNHIGEGEEEPGEEGGDANYGHLTTDEDEDWSRDRVLLGFSDTDIREAEKWLERTQASTPAVEHEWEELYSPGDLNPEQREVYDRVVGCVVAGEVEGRLIDLSGGAGTGKTRLIRTVLQNVEIITGDKNRIKVCAYTNSAASYFVGGVTAHKLFRLNVERSDRPQCRHQAELEGLRLAALQEDFTNTTAVIIDEKSMIGCYTLWCIDQRLRQARPHHAHLPFGGLLVVLAGDLSQLPPVGDVALYARSGKKTAKQQLGYGLYQQFTESYLLLTSMRQLGEENEMFRQELGRLARGSFTITDWRRWSTRELATLPAVEREMFETLGVKLCARKADMVTFNEAGLRRTGSPILVLRAVHNNRAAARGSDTKGQIPAVLPVARGASVVLTSNLWPHMKLLNGTRGTLTYVVYEEGRGPEDGLPAFLVVTFPEYTGPAFIPGEPGTVPIFTRLAEWKEGRNICKRRTFPLILGYSITLHKCQGEDKMWHWLLSG